MSIPANGETPTAPTTDPAATAGAPAAPATDPQGTPPPATDPAASTDAAWEASTGRGGKAAVLGDLAAAREEIRALKAAQTPTAPPAGTPKPEAEAGDVASQLQELQKQLAAERTARFRAETAASLSLTADDAAALAHVENHDAISAIAARLAAARADAAEKSASARQIDPAQGAKPDGTPTLGDQITDAEAKGDFRLASSLKARQLMESRG